MSAVVAYVSPDSNLFGSELSMLDVLESLDRARVAPRLVVTRPGPLVEAARAKGLETELLPWLAGPFGPASLAAPSAALRLAAWLRRRAVRVVELNRMSFGLLAVTKAAAALAGCRVVARVRMPGKPLSVPQKAALAGADRIISVSAAAVEPWKRGWRPGFLERRLRVIPDGRDVAALKRVPRDRSLLRALGVPDGAPVLGMVGAVTPNKRQDLFLAAAAAVAARRPGAWAVAVGGVLDDDSRPYAEGLAARTRGTALEGRFVATGYRADAAALMKNFDVLVLPSDREAFGGVLIEALALGVPVVAHNVDGTVEIVEDGRTGLLVSEQEPERYAAAMLRVLEDSALAARLRAAGLLAAERFDRASIARRIEAVYEELA